MNHGDHTIENDRDRDGIGSSIFFWIWFLLHAVPLMQNQNVWSKKHLIGSQKVYVIHYRTKKLYWFCEVTSYMPDILISKFCFIKVYARDSFWKTHLLKDVYKTNSGMPYIDLCQNLSENVLASFWRFPKIAKTLKNFKIREKHTS